MSLNKMKLVTDQAVCVRVARNNNDLTVSRTQDMTPYKPPTPTLPPRSTGPEVLNQMLHDIRTPLGTILGVADLLALRAKSPSDQIVADTLKSSSSELDEQIEALFKFLHSEQPMTEQPSPLQPNGYREI